MDGVDKTIISKAIKIHQKGMIMNQLVIALVLHRHAFKQHTVEGTVIGNGIHTFRFQYVANNLIKAACRQMRIDNPKCSLKVAYQGHF